MENVLHNLVFVLIVAIAILIPLGLLGYGVYKLARYYCDYLWDKITLAVVLISIAVVANFADAIKVILPVNCVSLVIVIQVLYVGVRNVIEVVRKSRRIIVKPQIISGEIRKLFPVKMPVAICGQRQDCTLFQL